MHDDAGTGRIAHVDVDAQRPGGVEPAPVDGDACLPIYGDGGRLDAFDQQFPGRKSIARTGCDRSPRTKSHEDASAPDEAKDHLELS
jgi:hypothetical protein